MSNLQTLIEQRNAVDRKIAGLREQAAARARAIIADYHLDLSDIFGKKRPERAPDYRHPLTGVKKVPQYRDPATGQTWAGTGLQPLWLRAHVDAGRSLDEFRL